MKLKASNMRALSRRVTSTLGLGRRGRILGLGAAFLASSLGAYAQIPVPPTPTLEDLPTGLIEMLGHLHLTHTQHEQVERILENESVHLWFIRGNPDLSVAQLLIQEQGVRMQARKQIESILTARQVEKIAKRMIHEMEEEQRWGYDHTAFFSIPSTY